jgi:3-oxoacyl-[acyl-carrier-protein] synthase II
MRRVVITGMGAVSSVGLDAPSSFTALVEGQSGIAPITLFDPAGFACTIAGECTGFDASRYGAREPVRSAHRLLHLALSAADEALQGTGIQAFGERMKLRTGVILGVGTGSVAGMAGHVREWVQRSARGPLSKFGPASLCKLTPGDISARHDIRGTHYAIESAGASGAQAIGEAFRNIACGDLDACLAGGSEAAVTALAVGAFSASRALTRRNGSPATASRPWDQARDGFVLAEGAGLLFLEEREQAKRRGAEILAELVGYGASTDSYHMAQSAPSGEGSRRAMLAALADAKLAPDRVDYLHAHAASTPSSDAIELKAARDVFGEHAQDKLWVSSTKGATGQLPGAAGGLEAVFSVLALRNEVVPPTLNLDHPAPEAQGLELVPHHARRRALSYVLSNAFGLNGKNTSLLFAKH